VRSSASARWAPRWSSPDTAPWGAGAVRRDPALPRLGPGGGGRGRRVRADGAGHPRRAPLGEFAAWGDSERLIGNLHRAYAELTDPRPLGAPVDVGASFAEMVEFHGGLPDCHA
jgi:hypothetical protein